jgi:putative endonuclease
MAFVYLLECADGTYYTGWTVDLKARLEAHNAGTGSRYTRGRCPVRLVYWEQAQSKSEAMRREAALRRLSRTAKRCLAAANPAAQEEVER